MDFIVLYSFIPEIFFSICILLQLVFNAYLVNNFNFNFPIIDREVLSQIFFILSCLLILFLNSKIEGFFFNFLFLNDLSCHYLKTIFTICCLLIIPVIFDCFKIQQLNFFEYFTVFLLSILSLLLLISVGDMISAYLAIEMQALSFYILSSFKRDSSFSTEAGLKYFISGSFISGIFLFGCSIIYGLLGTLNFNNLSLLLCFPIEDKSFYFILLAGVSLIISTLLFKVSSFPFHFWSPDVYEGSPLSSTIIFSIVPKISLFNFFIKVLSIFFLSFNEISSLLFFCGILSILIGTFFAIRQKRLKRFIIFSSITQTGFLIVALSTYNLNSLVSIYFFIIIYLITSIVLWTHFSIFFFFQEKINFFYNKSQTPLFLSNLSNFVLINKLWSFSFIMLFFSIAGIPPFVGFLSKIFILFGLVESNSFTGSFLIVIISSITVFYYLRVIKIIFFESNTSKNIKENYKITFNYNFFDFNCILISTCLFLLIFFFFNSAYLLLICHYIILGSFFF